MKDIVYEISKRFDIEIMAQEVNENHIHLLFSAEPTIVLMRYMNTLKGTTANKLFHRFPKIKEKLWSGHLWSPSYCLITTGISPMRKQGSPPLGRGKFTLS